MNRKNVKVSFWLPEMKKHIFQYDEDEYSPCKYVCSLLVQK